MKSFPLVVFLAVFCEASPFVAALHQCTGRAAMNDYEASGFVSLAYGGNATVGAQFLAAPGCTPVMFRSLRELGATLQFVDERVGYALVILPKEKVLDAL